MTHRFSELTFTPAVIAAQKRFGSAEQAERVRQAMPAYDQFGERERSFIHNCDSFFMASVNEEGWPYIQHRGGRKGFVQVVSATELVFANMPGNGQYQSLGNLSINDRVCLFMLDHAKRRRLKLLGRVCCYSREAVPERLQHFISAQEEDFESLLLITLEAFDWNCPRFITPRFTEAEFAALQK